MKKEKSKVTAAIIQKHLIDWVKRGYYDIVIPNFFFGFYFFINQSVIYYLQQHCKDRFVSLRN